MQIAGVAGQTEKPHQTLYDFQVTASQGRGMACMQSPLPPTSMPRDVCIILGFYLKNMGKHTATHFHPQAFEELADQVLAG